MLFGIGLLCKHLLMLELAWYNRRVVQNAQAKFALTKWLLWNDLPLSLGHQRGFEDFASVLSNGAFQTPSMDTMRTVSKHAHTVVS